MSNNDNTNHKNIQNIYLYINKKKKHKIYIYIYNIKHKDIYL